MKRIVPIIDRISEVLSGYVCAFLLAGMVVLIMAEVIARYVFNSPMGIGGEFSAYLLVVITFLSLAYTLKEGGHVRAIFVVNILPRNAQKWLRLITHILCIAFVLVLIFSNFSLVMYSFKFGTRSSTWLRIPQAWPQLFMILGTILLFFQSIAEFIKGLNALKSQKKDTK